MKKILLIAGTGSHILKGFTEDNKSYERGLH